MNLRISRTGTMLTLGLVFAGFATNRIAYAHCDTVTGPVAQAARAALGKGDASVALWWVQPNDEAEVRTALNRALSARKLSAASREVADRYFMETLVRIHRAGEGEPYTGLKPEGTQVDKAVLEADAALDSGSVDRLADEIADAVRLGIKARFEKARHLKEVANQSVVQGRNYVSAYVDYVHYVEALHAAATGGGHGSAHGKGKP